MQTTTPAAIRADFIAQIEAIVPRHVHHQNHRWRYIRRKRDVPSSTMRTFAIEQEVASEAGLIVQGDGRDYAYRLLVWTSYHGIGEDDDDSIISEDAADLSATLQLRYQPAVPGLMSVVADGWEEGDASDDGGRWGAHTFTVQYFAPHTA